MKEWGTSRQMQTAGVGAGMEGKHETFVPQIASACELEQGCQKSLESPPCQVLLWWGWDTHTLKQATNGFLEVNLVVGLSKTGSNSPVQKGKMNEWEGTDGRHLLIYRGLFCLDRILFLPPRHQII